MYESFFGFRERPFDLTPNPRFLVATDSHREALSNLEYAMASRKGIALLVGDAGSGKTTVIRAALERQPQRVHCVHLTNPALTRDEFVQMLAARFEIGDPAAISKTELLLGLEALLRRRREQDDTTVLVIDEAQSLSFELLEEVRLLANIETDDEKLITIVLAGQPELAERLDDVRLRQLKQRVALRCQLRPLTLRETLAYMAGRIRAAGGVPAQNFSREAVVQIHEASQGLPRLINVIADNALVAAFALGQRLVDTAIVREVCRDFALDSGRPAQPAADAPIAEPSTLAVEPLSAGSQPARSAPGDDAPAESGEGTNKGQLFGGFTEKRRRFFRFS